jgi:hypothetical protein
MVLSTSRFRYTPLVTTRSGNDTYGLVSGFDALKNMTDDQYDSWVVLNNFEGRPDLIAFEFYTNPQLEWVIVFANRSLNTLNWPKTGDLIKIPKKPFVESLL